MPILCRFSPPGTIRAMRESNLPEGLGDFVVYVTARGADVAQILVREMPQFSRGGHVTLFFAGRGALPRPSTTCCTGRRKT
jgi:hypothetical protein